MAETAIARGPMFRRVVFIGSVVLLSLVVATQLVIAEPMTRAAVRNLLILACAGFSFTCALYTRNGLHGRDRRTWTFITLAMLGFTVSYVIRLVAYSLLGYYMKSPSPDDLANLFAITMLLVATGYVGDPVRSRARVRAGRWLNFWALVIVAYVLLDTLVMRPLDLMPADHFTARSLIFSVYLTLPLAMAMYPVIFRDEPWSEWALTFVASLSVSAVYTITTIWLIGAGGFSELVPAATLTDAMFTLVLLLMAMASASRASLGPDDLPRALPREQRVRWAELALMLLAVFGVPFIIDQAIRASDRTTSLIAGVSATVLTALLIGRSALATVEASRGVNSGDSAERYSSVVENSPVAVLVLDRRGVVLYANPSAAATLHAATPFDLLGIDVDRFLPEDSPEEFADLIEITERFVADPSKPIEPLPSRRNRLITLDGAPIVVERTAAVISFGGEPALLVQGADVTARVRAESEIVEYRQRLQGFADELVRAEEAERRELAQALHDYVGQPLAVSRMRLQSAKADGLCSGDDVDVAFQMIEQAISETRLLTTELAPQSLYELGVEAAITGLAEGFQRSYGLTVECSGHMDDSGLSDELRAALYRAVRELLMNVVKHAMTSRAAIEFRNVNGSLSVTVSDRGVGFDTDEAAGRPTESFGLFSIRERIARHGGSLEIESAPGEGARVEIRVPREA